MSIILRRKEIAKELLDVNQKQDFLQGDSSNSIYSKSYNEFLNSEVNTGKKSGRKLNKKPSSKNKGKKKYTGKVIGFSNANGVEITMVEYEENGVKKTAMFNSIGKEVTDTGRTDRSDFHSGRREASVGSEPNKNQQNIDTEESSTENTAINEQYKNSEYTDEENKENVEKQNDGLYVFADTSEIIDPENMSDDKIAEMLKSLRELLNCKD